MILVFIDTKSAAKKVARNMPGTAVIVEATPEMFVEAINKAIANKGTLPAPPRRRPGS